MTNSAVQWVGVGLTSLVVIGGSIAAYVDVKSDIAVVETKLDQNKEDKKELDKYDSYLQKQLDEHGDRLLKTEAKQEGIEKTQDRLERTMDEILKEMRTMNDNIIILTEKGKD
jgi:predicted nuclease with TOPRIM domain